MKIIVYIVIIVLLVGCAFACVKALQQSSLFQSVANAVDTVKDFVDNTGDGSNGSSSQSGEGGNQSGESGTSQGSGQGGSHVSTTDRTVTEIYDVDICRLFTLKKHGETTARQISVGDVFEEGDTIYCNQSLYTDEQLSARIRALPCFVSYGSMMGGVVSGVGSFLFGNDCVEVKCGTVNLFGTDVHIYQISICDINVFHCYDEEISSMGWSQSSVELFFAE